MHVLALFEFNISRKCIISAFSKVQVVFGDPDFGQSARLSLVPRRVLALAIKACIFINFKL